MWYWLYIRNKFWDWFRPIYYRNRPRTSLTIQSIKHVHRTEISQEK